MSIREDADRRLDAVVVGGGPAGLTAATYLRRFKRSCLVLDAGHSRARWIPESNNCPGFPQGVSGVELLKRMKQQAMTFDTEFESALVESIGRDADGFVLASAAGRWRARCVILATGLADKLPDAPWVEAAIACNALRLCPVCDAYEACDTRIGVYGPMADIVEHGLFLRTYSSRVVLLPSDRDEGGDSLARAIAIGIELLPYGGTLGFDGTRCTYALEGRSTESFDCVYPFLGTHTSAGLASALGATLSQSGEIVVDRHQMTDVRGLYAIGDVVSGLNQISVAVGQAAIAATAAHRRLPFAPRPDAERMPGRDT